MCSIQTYSQKSKQFFFKSLSNSLGKAVPRYFSYQTINWSFYPNSNSHILISKNIHAFRYIEMSNRTLFFTISISQEMDSPVYWNFIRIWRFKMFSMWWDRLLWDMRFGTYIDLPLLCFCSLVVAWNALFFWWNCCCKVCNADAALLFAVYALLLLFVLLLLLLAPFVPWKWVKCCVGWCGTAFKCGPKPNCNRLVSNRVSAEFSYALKAVFSGCCDKFCDCCNKLWAAWFMCKLLLCIDRFITVRSFGLCGKSMAATAAAAALFFFKPKMAAIVKDLAPAEPLIVSNCVSSYSVLDLSGGGGGGDDDGGIDDVAVAALRMAKKFDK